MPEEYFNGENINRFNGLYIDSEIFNKYFNNGKWYSNDKDSMLTNAKFSINKEKCILPKGGKATFMDNRIYIDLPE